MTGVKRLALSCLVLLALGGCRGGGTPAAGSGGGDETKQIHPGTAGVKEPGKACFAMAWGPVLLSSGKQSVAGISAATGVGQVGVMWIETEESRSDAYFVRLTGGVQQETIRITTGGSAYPPSALAWTGKEFALAWGDDRLRRIEIFTARVSPTGKVTAGAKRFTQTSGAGSGDVYASDSSQEPALAYYGDNLLMVWGGPGDEGSQQVYHTTVSKNGSPLYDPYEITKGPFHHAGMNLAATDEGAGLLFCVHKGDENEIFRAVLGGTPPEIVSQPSRLAGTVYSTCWSTEVAAGEASGVLWADTIESEGLTDDILKIVRIGADGTFGAEALVEGVRLLKFPGKFRRPFGAATCSGNAAIAWLHAPPGGETEVKAGVFSLDGRKACEPLTLESRIGPTDVRIVYSGQEKVYVVLWVDREMGGTTFSLYAAGVDLVM